MADIASEGHDPSPPSSDASAPAQGSRPNANHERPLRVFISYSRKDLEFADQLEEALQTCRFDTVMDRHDISGGEDWKARLGELIRGADTIVFVLSPASAVSPVCAWEAEEAAGLAKRILPVICSPLGDTKPPARFQALNYTFFYDEPTVPRSGFGGGLKRLVDALNTDFEWLRERTRYLQRATEWNEARQPANRLLFGDDIAEAKAWAARRPKSAPELAPLELDFIRASEQEALAQSNVERKRLEAMAAAQEEREKALREAETAQKARTRIARFRDALLVLALIFATGAGWETWQSQKQTQLAQKQTRLAESQKKEAETQRRQADDILKNATDIIVSVEDNIDDVTRREVFALFQAGAAHGAAEAMRALGGSYETGSGVAQDYAKAREWYEKAAAKGDARAMVDLGLLYDHGQGVPQNPATARGWYQKAAEAGKADPIVGFELSAIYGDARGVPQDGRARELYEQAADKGDSMAMVHLGYLYAFGIGTPVDGVKAREWFEKAAKKGNAIGSFGLGLLNDQGSGQNFAKAREWIEKGAGNGDTFGMVALGLLYENGRGVPQDYGNAREWYEKAADKGEQNAMVALGLLYENGRGVAQDYAKAREWYEKAADKGDAAAMVDLATLYLNARGVERDYGRARELLEKAADKGNADAMRDMGTLYFTGQGVPRDFAKAGEWFAKAADKGDVVSMSALGTLYFAGQGVPQDYGKAREWLQKAADKDSVDGMRGLGMLYGSGLGAPPDYSKAYEWFAKAAAKGDAASMSALGELYEKGQGAPQDAAKAREWYGKAAVRFEKAADDGDTASMAALGMLYEKGQGVPQDAAKARDWLKKAADKGNPDAKQMEAAAVGEAAAHGRYGEALSFQQLLAAQTEKQETEQQGKPAAETARALGDVAWYALLTREFDKALFAADHAHALLPDDLTIETNRAHALMFLGREDEARALYLAHKGERLPEANKPWEQAIAEDFAQFRKAGLTRPMMDDIEKQLGVAQ